MSCKEETEQVLSSAGTKLPPAIRCPGFHALFISISLAKRCSCLFIKYQTRNQKMLLLLLPSSFPEQRCNLSDVCKSISRNQPRNTALLSSDEESFFPVLLQNGPENREA